MKSALNYNIRDIEKNDLTQLVVLCAHHAEYEQAEYSGVGKEQKLYSAFFDPRPALYSLVVEVDAQLVGFTTYTFDYSTWDAAYFLYLDCLYLEPEFRGHKIGENIFEILKKRASDRDCVNIQWQTPVFNERAIKFYKRMGGLVKEKSRFTLPM